MDIVRRLAAGDVQVPFVKAGRHLQASLAAGPGTAVARRGLDGLDACVDRRRLGRLALREERNETPAQCVELPSAVDSAQHGYHLRRCHVEARGDVLRLAHQVELALDRGLVRRYVSPAHDWPYCPSSLMN